MTDSSLIKSDSGKLFPQLQVMRGSSIISYANLGTWAAFSMAGTQQSHGFEAVPRDLPLDVLKCEPVAKFILPNRRGSI